MYGRHRRMASNADYSAWTWQDRKNNSHMLNSRYFSKQSLLSLVYMLIWYFITPMRAYSILFFFPHQKSAVEIKSTVGIECSVLNVEDTPVSVWDFAGQLEYTVTHQYFLSSKVLFLIFRKNTKLLIN